MPTRPERGSTLDVPQLDAAISASTGEQAFVRAESEDRGNIRMRLPDPVQGLACPAPQPHFPTPTSSGPVLPALADGDRPDGIKGLGQDTLLEPCPGQSGILQLDALQIHAAQDQPRQIEATQVPAHLAQQGQ